MSKSIEIGDIVILAEKPPEGFQPVEGKRYFALLDPSDFAAATYVKSLAEQRGLREDELAFMVDSFAAQAERADPNAEAPPHSAVEKRLRELVGDKADFASFPMSPQMLSAVSGFIDWVAPAAEGAEATTQATAEQPSTDAKLKAAVADERYYSDAEYRANVDAQFKAAYPAQPATQPAAPSAAPQESAPPAAEGNSDG